MQCELRWYVSIVSLCDNCFLTRGYQPDGASPSGVQQTANTATASANGNLANGATMGDMPVGIAISAILTLSSALAFLA